MMSSNIDPDKFDYSEYFVEEDSLPVIRNDHAFLEGLLSGLNPDKNNAIFDAEKAGIGGGGRLVSKLRKIVAEADSKSPRSPSPQRTPRGIRDVPSLTLEGKEDKLDRELGALEQNDHRKDDAERTDKSGSHNPNNSAGRDLLRVVQPAFEVSRLVGGPGEKITLGELERRERECIFTLFGQVVVQTYADWVTTALKIDPSFKAPSLADDDVNQGYNEETGEWAVDQFRDAVAQNVMLATRQTVAANFKRIYPYGISGNPDLEPEDYYAIACFFQNTYVIYSDDDQTSLVLPEFRGMRFQHHTAPPDMRNMFHLLIAAKCSRLTLPKNLAVSSEDYVSAGIDYFHKRDNRVKSGPLAMAFVPMKAMVEVELCWPEFRRRLRDFMTFLRDLEKVHSCNFDDPDNTIQMEYQKGPAVGKGSYGVVYRCLNVNNGRFLALKELPLVPKSAWGARTHSKLGDDSFRQSGVRERTKTGREEETSSSLGFHTNSLSSPLADDELALEEQSIRVEIETLKSLKHRNVISYYGCTFDRKAKTASIMMEYCPKSLRDIITEHKGLTVSLVQHYGKAVLDGLVYLHSSYVIHRDIKSHNVLVTETGEVKLSDFGTALLQKPEGFVEEEEEREEDKLLRRTAAVGTPLFMAPEILKGIGIPSEASDMWAFGCLLVEMISGELPYQDLVNKSTSLPNLLYLLSQQSKGPQLDEELKKQLPPGIFSVLEACLDPSPLMRPTASTLAAHPFFTPTKSSRGAQPRTPTSSSVQSASGFLNGSTSSKAVLPPAQLRSNSATRSPARSPRGLPRPTPPPSNQPVEGDGSTGSFGRNVPSEATFSPLLDNAASPTTALEENSNDCSQQQQSNTDELSSKPGSGKKSPPLSFAGNQDNDTTRVAKKRELLVEKIASGEEQFEEMQVLGRGAFGVVKSVILSDGSVVAMKEVALTDSSSKARVMEEVNVVKGLHLENEHVVSVYGARVLEGGTTPHQNEGGKVQIFMEYYPAGSLSSLVKSVQSPLRETTVRIYIAQIVDALACLHRRGILHRDLKADNIFFTQRGQCKVGDFGSAKAGLLGRQHSGAETMIGTPYFMSPEVINGGAGSGDEEEPAAEHPRQESSNMTLAELGPQISTGYLTTYGMKADVWSLGILTLEILNQGKAPWPDFTNVTEALIHIGGPSGIPIIPDHVTDKDCISFIRACCERDPTKRASSESLRLHPWLKENCSGTSL